MDLFLDTTIHIDRHFRGEVREKDIERNIENCKVYSSKYVLDQYKKTIVNSVILFFNLLSDEATKSPSEAYWRSKSYESSTIARGKLTSRVQSMIADIFATYVVQCDNNKEAVLERLQIWIEDLWEEYFNLDIEQPLINLTDCKRCDGLPLKKEFGYEPIHPDCTIKKKPDCEIENFWNEYGYYLEQVRRANEDDFKDQKIDKINFQNVKKNALQVIDENKSVYGKRCSVFFSDLIITIESTQTPTKSELFTTDKDDFRPLCQIVDATLLEDD